MVPCPYCPIEATSKRQLTHHVTLAHKLTYPTEYDIIYRKQDGRCAICGKRSPKRKFDRDHDHTLERELGIYVLRGLLCRRCNQALGPLEWNDEVLDRAIKYLQKIKRIRKQVRRNSGEQSN